MTKATGVRLERPMARHRVEFLAAVRRSARLHAGWVHPPRTGPQYQAFLDRLRRRGHAGYLVRNAGGDLVGMVVVSEIVGGNFRSGYLGYYAFVPHDRRGYLRRAIELVLTNVFRTHALHRVEANIQPDNARSIGLVRGLGFRLEGYSPRYLKVRGRWRDHERWALTIEDWRSHRTRGVPASGEQRRVP